MRCPNATILIGAAASVRDWEDSSSSLSSSFRIRIDEGLGLGLGFGFGLGLGFVEGNSGDEAGVGKAVIAVAGVFG